MMPTIGDKSRRMVALVHRPLVDCLGNLSAGDTWRYLPVGGNPHVRIWLSVDVAQSWRTACFNKEQRVRSC